MKSQSRRRHCPLSLPLCHAMVGWLVVGVGACCCRRVVGGFGGKAQLQIDPKPFEPFQNLKIRSKLVRSVPKSSESPKCTVPNDHNQRTSNIFIITITITMANPKRRLIPALILVSAMTVRADPFNEYVVLPSHTKTSHVISPLPHR